VSAALDLREAWADVLARRPALAQTLAVYGTVFDLWADVTPPAPLDLDAEACRDRWRRGIPLVADVGPVVATEPVEALLGPLLDIVEAVRPDTAAAVDAFVAGWERGEIRPESLLPSPSGFDTLPTGTGLPPDVVAFLAVGSLRPLLEPTVGACRGHLVEAGWELGRCPFCGAPPAWGDIGEEGRLDLACHLCGGAWTFARLRCTFCGTDDARGLRRLSTEGREGGYALSTCTACRGYLKTVDRRERWNAGPALVEDWGSPHLDLAAVCDGYARPMVPLILTADARCQGAPDPPGRAWRSSSSP
jgi:hypothetical protein